MLNARITVLEETADGKVLPAMSICRPNFTMNLGFQPHENDFIRLWEDIVIRVRKATYDAISSDHVDVIASMPTVEFEAFAEVVRRPHPAFTEWEVHGWKTVA